MMNIASKLIIYEACVSVTARCNNTGYDTSESRRGRIDAFGKL